MDERALLRRRLSELRERAARSGVPCRTEFLTLDEQALARAAGADALAGGYDAAERRVAVFGGGESAAPLAVLHVAPRDRRFAEALSHRDLLGSLMSLGLRRAVFGDLLAGEDGDFYLFCLPEQAPYVCENWREARHTPLTVAPAPEGPPQAAAVPEESELVIPSARLDALIAAVWRLSRGESQRLFAEGRVFVDGRAETRPDRDGQEGAHITVRGMGRFCYLGVARETRKGRLRARVRVWR